MSRVIGFVSGMLLLWVLLAACQPVMPVEPAAAPQPAPSRRQGM